MSDLVGNPEDRFSRVAAQVLQVSKQNLESVDGALQLWPAMHLFQTKTHVSVDGAEEVIVCYNGSESDTTIFCGTYRA